MKCFLFPVVFFLFNKAISGQNNNVVQFGNVTIDDFTLPKSSVIDSNTTAVVMADIGSTHFIGNKYHWFSYVYNGFARIKILNKKAFEDLATLKIYLYGKGDRKDQLTDFKASVYNLENNRLVTTSVNRRDMFEDKLSPFLTENKISFPTVKEGSVIEYSYTITSQRFFDIPSWYFQRVGYPCLRSEYEVTFPDAIRYLSSHYGNDSFYKDETSIIKNNKYYMADVTVISNDIRKRWSMKDIPAFRNEKFIYSPRDYLNKIEFTLAQTYDGQDVHNQSTTWEAVTNDLLEDSQFGAPIEKDATFNLVSTVEKITSSAKDLMESARNIFFYVRDNFVCLPDNNIFLRSDPYEINKKKKGNVADLNLLVIALLRLKGIDADPVILSTREYGKNPSDYPILEKMNYVICMVRTFIDTVYLDASRRDMGFGQLPLNCYNGHARIISKNGDSVYFSAAKMKERETISVFITNEGIGKLGGSCESVFGDFKTEVLKKEIKSSGIKKYFDDIRAGYTGEIEIMNTGIDSLSKTGGCLKTHFEFTVPIAGDLIYFNPLIMTEYKQNPFMSEERKYPVSLSVPIDNLYTLNMEIPEGYVIDELPKSAKVSFNDNQGLFEYSIQANKSNLQFRSRICLNEDYFPPEDYQSLREFFSFILKKHNEQIVFKKKT